LAHHSEATGEFPTVDCALYRQATDTPARVRRRWSTARSATGVAFLVTTFGFVIAILLQPRHGLNELPQIALDVFRSYWSIALIAALSATAYDVIAPKWLGRFSSLGDGVRAVERGQAQLVSLVHDQAAELAQVRRDAGRSAATAARLAEAQEHHIGELIAKVERVLNEAADRQTAEYVKGFNDGLDRLQLHIPQPTPSPEDGGPIPITSARRRGV
jgi:hypothetical protein